MKTIEFRVKKKKCKDICPIPITLIPKVEKGIEKINYDKKTKIATVIYNEKLLSKKQVINKLRKIGYGVEE